MYELRIDNRFYYIQSVKVIVAEGYLEADFDGKSLDSRQLIYNKTNSQFYYLHTQSMNPYDQA